MKVNTDTSMQPILKSSLKLQSVDSVSGLYEWNRKVFTLNVKESTLSSESIQEAADHRDSYKVTEFPITGALSAKEWTLTSPMTGYGFDLIWASGKTWSFLADDQETCSSWVASLNKSISIAKDKSVEYMSSGAGSGVMLDETTIARSPDSIRSNQDKTINQYNPSPSSSGSKGAETPFKASTTNVSSGGSSSSGIGNNKNQIIDNSSEEEGSFGKQTGNISAIPVIDSSSSSSTPDTVSSSESGMNQDASPEPRRDGSNIMETQRLFPQHHTFIDPSTMNMAARQQVVHGTPPPPLRASQDTYGGSDMIYEYASASTTPPHPPPALTLSVDPQAYDDLRHKYYALQRTSNKDKIEVEMLRDQVGRLQEEMETRTSMMEEELKETWEKYRSDNQGIRHDIEKRVIRAENKANSLHEAELHSTREQYTREIECLKEELAAERKRTMDTVNKEKELLAVSQAKEAELRFEIQTMKDNFERLEGEVVKLREFGRLESLKWQNEKQSMQKDHDKSIQKLTDERDSLLVKCQEEIRSKRIEMGKNFDSTIKDIEASIVATLQKEHESDKFMAIQKIQMKCNKDIEIIRADEKKLAVKEIEAVRKMFMERERQTAEDLNKLESLHNDRCSALEKKCADLKQQNEDMKVKQKNAILERDNSLMDAQHNLQTHLKHLEDHQQRGHKLALELKEAHDEIQASKHRENDYRQQLAKSIEECRLQQAELIEIKRQASEAAAEAYAWKKAAQDSDSHHIVGRKEIQIAKDEVTMLEHELKMVREENWHLKSNLVGKKGGRGCISSNMMPAHSKVSPVSYPIRSANAISKKHSPLSSSPVTPQGDSANAASPSSNSNRNYRYYPSQVQFVPSNASTASYKTRTSAVPSSSTSKVQNSSTPKKYAYGSGNNTNGSVSTSKLQRSNTTPRLKDAKHHPSTAPRYVSRSPSRNHPTCKEGENALRSNNDDSDMDGRGSTESLPGYWVPSGISTLKPRHNSPARVAPSHVTMPPTEAEFVPFVPDTHWTH